MEDLKSCPFCGASVQVNANGWKHYPEEQKRTLINKDFAGLTPEEFDKTIEGLSGLAPIIVPFLLKHNFEGLGIEDAAEFNLDLQIATDAVIEIKQQVYGVESAGGESDTAQKYSWDFNRDCEIWRNCPCDSIQECIEQAKQAIHSGEYCTAEPPKVVYIGANVPFVPQVDPDNVLDQLECEASDFAGEVGGDWMAYNHKKRDELDELADSLSAVVVAWMDKYGYTPTFYAVQNIKEYPLT